MCIGQQDFLPATPPSVFCLCGEGSNCFISAAPPASRILTPSTAIFASLFNLSCLFPSQDCPSLLNLGNARKIHPNTPFPAASPPPVSFPYRAAAHSQYGAFHTWSCWCFCGAVSLWTRSACPCGQRPPGFSAFLGEAFKWLKQKEHSAKQEASQSRI